MATTAPDFPIDFLDAIDSAVMGRQGKQHAKEKRFICPAHEDRNPSADWNRSKATWCCRTCGAGGGAIDLANLLGVPLPPKSGATLQHPRANRPNSAGTAGKSRNVATNHGDATGPQHCNTGNDSPGNTGKTDESADATPEDAGYTVADYAADKHLSEAYLRNEWGLTDVAKHRRTGNPAIRMPYSDEHGNEVIARIRIRRTKAGGQGPFVWPSGGKPCLYGRSRKDEMVKRGYCLIVEGESDTQTAWLAGHPAIGVPGANMFKPERDLSVFDGIDRIYVWKEPDEGGERLLKDLSACDGLRDRLYVIQGDASAKDISDLHTSGVDTYAEIQKRMDCAVPVAQVEQEQSNQKREEAWRQCETLARQPDILGRVAGAMQSIGVAGESRNAKLLYLQLVTRFLDKPVSSAIKGESSTGKSFELKQVLKLLPESAYLSITGMSPRALAYLDEDLSHRFLIIAEADGADDEFASFLIRTLLSEGRILYYTNEATDSGVVSKKIEREGPTGFITTTTRAKLHPENETRLISIGVDDSKEQTKSILLATAEYVGAEIDVQPWHALQEWLALSEHRVVIPFAMTLAEMIPPLAVRLRRDFPAFLSLIRAHAILHQASRDRDQDGAVIATLDDYSSVHAIAADLLSAGLGATVTPSVRETVAAIQNELIRRSPGTLRQRAQKDDAPSLSVSEIAKLLNLDKSSVSRRVRVATQEGYLLNLESKRGRPAKLVVGDAMPGDEVVFPEVDALRLQWRRESRQVQDDLPPTGTDGGWQGMEV